MRISDWSSDVCSSDLQRPLKAPQTRPDRRPHSITSSKGQNPSCITGGNHRSPDPKQAPRDRILARLQDHVFGAVAVSCDDLGVGGKDRKSVGKGKGVSVRVDLGGRRIIKKKKQ